MIVTLWRLAAPDNTCQQSNIFISTPLFFPWISIFQFVFFYLKPTFKNKLSCMKSNSKACSLSKKKKNYRATQKNGPPSSTIFRNPKPTTIQTLQASLPMENLSISSICPKQHGNTEKEHLGIRESLEYMETYKNLQSLLKGLSHLHFLILCPINEEKPVHRCWDPALPVSCLHF